MSLRTDQPKEFHEGPDAARRFENALNRVLDVSKGELIKREAAYKKSRKAKKPQPKKST